MLMREILRAWWDFFHWWGRFYMLARRAGEVVSRRETPSQCGRVGSPAKLVPQCFMSPIEHYWLCFVFLEFYFVDFYGMFTSSPTWRLKMHVLCKVGKNIIFQNKTLLIMFYRRNKHFGTNFVILNIFWKQKIVKTVWSVRV